MSEAHYLDREGRPLTQEQWGALLADDTYREVARDERGDVLVSTVWIGIAWPSFRWVGGPSLIFETMIFGGEDDGAQWRWATEEQARAGHAEICSSVLRTRAPRA